MEATFIAALAGLTSIGAYYFGARTLGLSSARLGAAIGKMLESVGIVLIFLAVNLATAVAIVLDARPDRCVRLSVRHRRRGLGGLVADPGPRLPVVAGAFGESQLGGRRLAGC